jgi:hypothetical protein
MPKEITEEVAQRVINGAFLDCSYIHDGSCEKVAVMKFLTVSVTALKFYLPVHLIPIILFKRKKLSENPRQTIKNAIKNIFKSCMFLATYVSIFRYLLCFLKNYRHKVDKWNVILGSFFCTFGLLWEPAHRRTELALYLFPRFMEAFWNKLLREGLVKSFQFGEVLVFSLAMGIIMFCY